MPFAFSTRSQTELNLRDIGRRSDGSSVVVTVTSTRSKFARLSGSALVLGLTDLPGLVLVLDVAGLPGRTPGRAFDLGIAEEDSIVRVVFVVSSAPVVFLPRVPT